MAYAAIHKGKDDFKGTYSTEEVLLKIRKYLKENNLKPVPLGNDLFYNQNESLAVKLEPEIDSIPPDNAIGDGYFDEPDTQIFIGFGVAIEGENEVKVAKIKKGIEEILCPYSFAFRNAFQQKK